MPVSFWGKASGGVFGGPLERRIFSRETSSRPTSGGLYQKTLLAEILSIAIHCLPSLFCAKRRRACPSDDGKVIVDAKRGSNQVAISWAKLNANCAMWRYRGAKPA